MIACVYEYAVTARHPKQGQLATEPLARVHTHTIRAHTHGVMIAAVGVYRLQGVTHPGTTTHKDTPSAVLVRTIAYEGK